MSKLPHPPSVAPRQHTARLPRRPASQPLPGRAVYKGRAVGAMLPKITRKVFEKFGFSTATLLTDWAIIVGADLAAFTAPERLKWPRGYEGAATGEAEAGRPGATLMLRVEPARALDVQYKARLLIDRINAYFGYRAVAEIRLVQAPLIKSGGELVARRGASPPGTPGAAVQAVADDALREALASLEASIRAENASRRR